MIDTKKFTEIIDGIWYEEETGFPWSSKRGRFGHDGHLKRLHNKNTRGYFCVTVDGKPKSWHRLVYEFFKETIPDKMQVDHMNNHRCDNRISNLQLLSNQKNSQKRLKNKDNISGYAGVSWNKPANKFKAQIRINNKVKHLGYFLDPKLAYACYLENKIKYHGAESIAHLLTTRRTNE